MTVYTKVQRAKHATLTVNTADTVQMSLTEGHTVAEVVCRTAVGLPVFFRVDGQPASVSGDDCYVVMPGAYARVPIPQTLRDTGAVLSVSVISAGAQDYSVTGLPE